MNLIWRWYGPGKATTKDKTEDIFSKAPISNIKVRMGHRTKVEDIQELLKIITSNLIALVGFKLLVKVDVSHLPDNLFIQKADSVPLEHYVQRVLFDWGELIFGK